MNYCYYSPQIQRIFELNTNEQPIDQFLNDTVNPYEYTIKKSGKLYLIREIATREIVSIIFSRGD